MATAKKKLATAPKKSATAKKAVKPALKKSPPAKPHPAAKKGGPAAKKAGPAAKKLPPAPVPAKAEKVKKPKLVRDSFTIPKAEYTVLDDLKQRAAKLTRPAKKSELLRAGIKALAALSDAAFLTALEQVPTIKTGRPGKS